MLHWNIISSSRDSSFFYQSKSLIAWSWPCVNSQCFCGKSKIECKPKAACQSTTSIVACSKRKGLPLKHFRDISIKGSIGFWDNFAFASMGGGTRLCQAGRWFIHNQQSALHKQLSVGICQQVALCLLHRIPHQVAVRYIGIPAQGVTSYCACVSIAVRSSLTFRW